jgi:hypothetical protein
MRKQGKEDAREAASGLATSIRLTPDGKRLVEALQARLGLKRSGVIELAIRRLAQAEGVE